MEKSIDSLTAHKVIALQNESPVLGSVLHMVVKLLTSGYSHSVIAQLLDINLTHVIKDLIAKDVLMPDTSLKYKLAQDSYCIGYIFQSGSGKYYDARLNDLARLETADIGDPCIEEHYLPPHYRVDSIMVTAARGTGQRAVRLTEKLRREI